MLKLFFVGTKKESMTNFSDFLSEGVVGWKPFVENEFTVSGVRPLNREETAYVMTVTIGDDNPDIELHTTVIDYDRLFFDDNRSKELDRYLVVNGF